MLFQKWAAAAILAVLPVCAGATTISPGDYVTLGFSLGTSETKIFDYTPTSKSKISFIAISGTGKTKADLEKVSFGLATADNHYSVYTNTTPVSATGGIPSFVTSGPFSLIFKGNGSSKPTSATYTFEVANVPVPAGGLLLLTAICGGSALTRKRKASA